MRPFAPSIRFHGAPMLTAFALLFVALAVACGGGGTSAGSARDYLQQASAAAQRSDWSDAVDAYTKAVALDAKSDTAYEGRANAYVELGDLDKAVADYSKAISLAPGRGGPYYGRGVAYRKQARLDEAISDLSKAIGDRGKTKWRGALYERGLAYKAKGMTSDARADFQRIVELEKQYPGEADSSWAEKAEKELSELGA